jgi:hypothetical protein
MPDMQLTSYPNGISAAVLDKNAILKEANYTVVAKTDSGKTFYSTADAIVYSLPAVEAGTVVTFENMAEDGAAGITINPNGTDTITYLASLAAGKGVVNTKATAKKGDYITLQSLGGTTWNVMSVRGIWAKVP